MKNRRLIGSALVIVLALLCFTSVSFASGTIQRGLIGQEDISWWTGGTTGATSFNRTTSSGYSLALKKVGRIISPIDYGAKGDGVTSDQTALASAVAAALAIGADIYWLPGTYLSTASIPDFHSVRHFGPGIIKRGTDLFYITPQGTQTNIIYYAPSGTGLDANDGLSAAEPRLTLADLATTLHWWSGLGRMLDGQWRFQFAAGTWTDQQIKTNYAVYAKRPVQIWGTSSGAAPYVTPTTIIDLTAASTVTTAMHFEPGFLLDVRYFDLRGMPVVPLVGNGIFMKNGGEIDVYDCLASSFADGYQAYGNATASFYRCNAENVGRGFEGSYNSTVNVGSASMGATSICKVLSPNVTGVYVTRNTIAHLDHSLIEDSSFVGLWVDMAARVNVLGTIFKRCAAGVLTYDAATWYNNTTTVNSFSMGTADACTVAYKHMDASREANLYGDLAQVERRIGTSRDTVAHTGTVTETSLYTVSYINGARVKIPAWWFADSGKRIRIKIWGTKTNASGGAKTLTVKIGDYSPWATANIIATSSLSVVASDFECEFEITALTATTQVQRTAFALETGPVIGIVPTSARAGDFGRDVQIRIYGELGDAADTLTINGYELYLMG
jgi:hypothetical protein